MDTQPDFVNHSNKDYFDVNLRRFEMACKVFNNIMMLQNSSKIKTDWLYLIPKILKEFVDKIIETPLKERVYRARLLERLEIFVKSLHTFKHVPIKENWNTILAPLEQEKYV